MSFNLFSIQNNRRGFSLVEIMVSLGMFAIVIVVALGAFLKILDSNRKAQSLKSATNNINFTAETISRELRVGTHYNCSDNAHTSFPDDTTSDCVRNNPGTSIAFRSTRTGADCRLYNAYSLQNNAIVKVEQETCGDNSITQAMRIPMTSPDVKITDFQVITVNASDDDSAGSVDLPSPTVTLIIRGEMGEREKIKSVFDLQTSVTQRLHN